jgi:hypothetical protein
VSIMTSVALMTAVSPTLRSTTDSESHYLPARFGWDGPVSNWAE